MAGTLFLVPTVLGEESDLREIPVQVREQVLSIRNWIAEEEKTARRHIKKMAPTVVQSSLQFQLLNKHHTPQDHGKMLKACLDGEDIGLISEAGCPAVADPGADLVAAAHRLGIAVFPLTGPSSILLAVMGSGFSGQKFMFHGYLPIDAQARKQKIRDLEVLSRKERMSIFFIETPYRNNTLLQALLQSLHPDTRVSIASELTQPNQWVSSHSVKDWKSIPDLHKKPVVFGLQASF